MERLSSHKELYAAGVRAIAQSGFPQYWEQNLLHRIESACHLATTKIAGYDLKQAKKYLEDLKDSRIPGDIYVYVSYCSYPLSYYLCDGSFLQNSEELEDERYMLRTLVHEQFHGFASADLHALHERIVKEDAYLRAVLEDNEWAGGLGPEEMYVKAVEHYICHRLGVYTREEIPIIQNGLYGNSLPLTVVILDLLLRETGDIIDFNRWVIRKLQDGSIRIGSLDKQCDQLIPGYSQNLTKKIACHQQYLDKLNRHGLYRAPNGGK